MYKLSGKRRKPWIARITTGWTDEGKQICKTIGTYPTKKEAQTALDTYLYVPNRPKEMTFKEAFEGWKSQTTSTHGTIQAYESGFKKLTRIYNVNVADMDLAMMQDAVDTSPVTYNTAVTIKKVLAVSLDFAFAHDCCPASRIELMHYIKLPEKVAVKPREIFTDDEIQRCIDDQAWAAVILLFTGLRRDEFINLKPEDIHLDEQWIHISKSKTEAGIRDVPLPDRLVPIFRAYLETGTLGLKRTAFENRWWKGYNCLSGHTRHECRHTYITKLTEAGIDPRYIKMLVGHSGTITEDVYTHMSMSKLLTIVNDVFNRYLPAGFDGPDHATYTLQA